MGERRWWRVAAVGPVVPPQHTCRPSSGSVLLLAVLRSLPPRSVSSAPAPMPPKRETAADKAARMQLASSQLRENADRTLIIHCMKVCPSSIGRIKRMLQDHGYLDADRLVATPEVTAVSTSPGQVEQPPALLPFDLGLPPPFVSAAKASCEFLLFLLEQLEPRACSKHSMRGLLTKGQRKLPKAFLLEICEFCLDILPDCSWPEHNTLEDLLADLGHRNFLQGRRLQTVAWPMVKWEDSGHFALKDQETRVLLYDRFEPGEAKTEVDLAEALGKPPAELHLRDLKLLNNWARSRAVLQCRGDLAVVFCASLLPLKPPPEVPQQPAAKRRMLALTNGPPAAQPAASAAGQGGPGPQAVPPSPRTPARTTARSPADGSRASLSASSSRGEEALSRTSSLDILRGLEESVLTEAEGPGDEEAGNCVPTELAFAPEVSDPE